MTLSNTQTAQSPYRLLRGRLSPMVTLELFHNREQVTLDAYVDSGAFYSIFIADVAEALGIEIHAGKLTYLTSVNGQILPLYLHRVGFRIADYQFTGEIGFSAQAGIGFNLLGRHSVFNQLRFCFDDRHNVLDITLIR